ncbi:MAG TPA: EamA family transporter [Solirubrobacteraceae bacterium]|nr:EamA family transporter [Solirubrobacteraceae bacterium]
MASEHATVPVRSLGGVPSPALVLGAIVSIQFGSALAASLFDQVAPAGVVGMRILAAALVMSLLVRPTLHGVGRREVALAAAFGAVLLGMNLCFYEAISHIPLGIAVAIEFLGPLAVAIVGSRRPRDVLWALLAAGGVAAMCVGGVSGVDTIGVCLALAAGGLWAMYILLNARIGRVFDGASGLSLAFVFATCGALPLAIGVAGRELLNAEVLLIGAAVGILASAVPYTLELEALRRIRPSVFGVLMSLEPAVAALSGFVVLGQALGARPLAGIAMVVAASLGVTVSDGARARLTP